MRCLLADPPEIGISKISKDANKKKLFVGFFGNCLRMEKPEIKFKKLGHWEWKMALVCGPGSRKHPPLPQSGLIVKPSQNIWLPVGFACGPKKNLKPKFFFFVTFLGLFRAGIFFGRNNLFERT
jgi:hypothetical protein